MDKIKTWLLETILKSPIFWSAATTMGVTELKKHGIAEGIYMDFFQFMAATLTAAFVGGAIKENTKLTQKTKDVAAETNILTAQNQELAIQTQLKVEDVHAVAVETKEAVKP